jgi:hypothetical protein
MSLGKKMEGGSKGHIVWSKNEELNGSANAIFLTIYFLAVPA